jgi:alpha-galactosidase
MADEVNVTFDQTRNHFHLLTDKMSYIFELVDNQYLIHRYWGRRLNHYNFSNRPTLKKRTFAATPDINQPAFSFETQPQEFSCPYQGDYREPSVEIRLVNGYSVNRFQYQSYEITDGFPELSGLPHIRNIEHQQAKTLAVNLLDRISQVKLTLYYSVLANSGALIRSAKLTNIGEEPVVVERLLSTSLDMDLTEPDVLSFYGSHQQEFQLNRQALMHGKHSFESTRGASSPQYPPILALCDKNTTEHSGDVYAMSLIYSGNHFEQVELDQYKQVRLSMGIHPETFSWQLQPNESFQSPEAVMVYSPDGLNGMSQAFHHLYAKYLIPVQWQEKERPVLLNSWEMSYFDVSEAKMLQVINKASELGFECVVLDDGWFGKRNDSKSSLGDWQVNPDKFPHGLDFLIQKANENDLSFGIWFEPEMISRQSQLFAQHPDWCVRIHNCEPMESRNQLVIDLTQTAVQTHIINVLTDFLSKHAIAYVKWDMNRHMTELGSMTLPSERTGEFAHRYMLGLYRILNELTQAFPNVLFENCSSGGGRFDAGMTYYMPQTWCSDNTDAHDRMSIQYGASYCFAPAMITAHVSDVPNHQTGREISFATRAADAGSVNMGYELNVLDLSAADETAIKQHIASYKQERDLMQFGKFYRLMSPFDGNTCAWMHISEDKSHVVVHFFVKSYNVLTLSYNLKIPYLKADARYRDESTGRFYSDAELAYAGLAIEPKLGDNTVTRIDLTLVRD